MADVDIIEAESSEVRDAGTTKVPLDPAAFTALVTALQVILFAHADAFGLLVLTQAQRSAVQGEIFRITEAGLRLDPNSTEALAVLLILSIANPDALPRFVTATSGGM